MFTKTQFWQINSSHSTHQLVAVALSWQLVHFFSSSVFFGSSSAVLHSSAVKFVTNWLSIKHSSWLVTLQIWHVRLLLTAREKRFNWKSHFNSSLQYLSYFNSCQFWFRIFQTKFLLRQLCNLINFWWTMTAKVLCRNELVLVRS